MGGEEGLTAQEYELELRQLREELRAYLEEGSGKAAAVLRHAEQVLALRDRFPEVFARYEEVEGLVADLLARERQKEVFAVGAPEPRSPGCLLGWFFRPRRKG